MRKFAALLIAFMALTASPLAAQAIVYEVVTEEVTELSAAFSSTPIKWSSKCTG